MIRGFRSDNNSGLCTEAQAALAAANDGSHRIGYGDDEMTERAVAAFRDLFGDDIDVFFVATGTAANTLAIASLTEPWQQVLCRPGSHYSTHESTAPERITGCRTLQIGDARKTKLSPEDLEGLSGFEPGDVHEAQAGVLTLTNATEFGTIYRADEVSALCERANELGYRVHVDGARFANAVAALDCDPRDITRDAGIDALSFGGSKNGLAFGEAVIFFEQGDGAVRHRAASRFPYLCKSFGHLLSKHRFITAPFEGTLRGGAWLAHARQANAMASRLADGLEKLGVAPVFAPETNAVFIRMPAAIDAALKSAGYGYYPFGQPTDGIYRLVCSFDTESAEVDQLLAVARSA